MTGVRNVLILFGDPEYFSSSEKNLNSLANLVFDVIFWRIMWDAPKPSENSQGQISCAPLTLIRKPTLGNDMIIIAV